MLKNLYIVLSTIAIIYLVGSPKEAEISVPVNDTLNIASLDSMASAISSNSDSLVSIINVSSGAITKKIEKAASTITHLKGEVTKLNGIIKEKDKQINELKTIVNNISSNLDSSFKLFAVPKEDRK